MTVTDTQVNMSDTQASMTVTDTQINMTDTQANMTITDTQVNMTVTDQHGRHWHPGQYDSHRHMANMTATNTWAIVTVKSMNIQYPAKK